MSEVDLWREIKALKDRMTPGPEIGGSYGARVYNSGAISHATSGTIQALTFDSERYDVGGMHSTGANTERLTCVHAGRYIIGGHIEWASNATGRRTLAIRLGGTTYIASQTVMAVTDASAVTTQSICTVYDLAVGNYVELMCNQLSGGALNVNASGNYSPEFWIQRY